ncbi:COP1-interactive protein 1-like [Salvia splendens]|uniref:COP1-interactive protein 1-like n=1 Tax=Salvia splendens TaxID=180675 RepID=UPI001C274168|nr:COP1-interactive protein 1-like [Salvia splendens]
MPKQRWRNSFKSFIDPSEDEQLRGIKTEIDGNVQKIVNFLKEKDGDDRKDEVADLIQDFHKQYDSLYARYDHLSGKLRNKFRAKSGKDSASSSSDSSDSDDFLAKSLAAAADEKEALHKEYLCWFLGLQR